jgi:hypothetical protein
MNLKQRAVIMNKATITNFVALLFSVSAVASANAQILTSFGASASNGGTWSYNSVTSTISGTESSGDLIYGTPNFSAYSGALSLQLTANATTAPTGTFTITLEDNSANLAVATYSWADFIGGATKTSAFSFGTFNFGNIVGWTLDSGGSSQAINVSLSNATAVVPEPATWAFLAFGLTTVMVLRRRRSQV